MDPDITYTSILAATVLMRAAIDTNDRAALIDQLDELIDNADALRTWLQAGGFLPSAAMDGGANPT